MQVLRAALALLLCSCAVEPPDDPDESDPNDPGSSGCATADLVTQRCGGISATSYLAVAARTTNVNEVLLIDAASGTTCSITGFEAQDPIANVTSLASIGTDVFFCGADAGESVGPLVQVSLLDGAVSTYTMECMSVTAYGGKLVVLRDIGSTVDVYSSFAPLGAPERVSLAECGPRLGFGDNKIYSTFPSPSSVYVYEPETKAASSFQLAPNSMGVFGLAANNGALTILDGLPDTQYLVTVDVATGAQIRSIAVGQQAVRLHGLSNTCSGSGMLL